MRRLALAVLAASFALTLVLAPWNDVRVSDLPLYTFYGDHFTSGDLPYRDVAFEYPPLAAVTLALPGLAGGGYDGYRFAFGVLVLAALATLVLLCGALAARTGGDRGVAMLAAAAAPLLAGAVLRTHFDAVPVVLLCAALLALVEGRTRIAFALLGLAVATKGFPLVVAPVALAWLAGRGRGRAAVEGAVVLVAVAGALVLAAVALSPAGARYALRYQVDRPAQVESAPAAVLLGLDALGAGRERGVKSYGSDGVLHPASGAVEALFAAALVGVLALLALGAAAPRAPPASERALVLASLAAVAAFAAFGKVFSPQFLTWLIPLAALALSWRMRPLALLLAGSAPATLMWFPRLYGRVVAHDAAVMALVAARDLAVIAAVGLAVRSLLRTRREPARGSGSPRQASRPRPRSPAAR